MCRTMKCGRAAAAKTSDCVIIVCVVGRQDLLSTTVLCSHCVFMTLDVHIHTRTLFVRARTVFHVRTHGFCFTRGWHACLLLKYGRLACARKIGGIGGRAPSYEGCRCAVTPAPSHRVQPRPPSASLSDHQVSIVDGARHHAARVLLLGILLYRFVLPRSQRPGGSTSTAPTPLANFRQGRGTITAPVSRSSVSSGMPAGKPDKSRSRSVRYTFPFVTALLVLARMQTRVSSRRSSTRLRKARAADSWLYTAAKLFSLVQSIRRFESGSRFGECHELITADGHVISSPCHVLWVIPSSFPTSEASAILALLLLAMATTNCVIRCAMCKTNWANCCCCCRGPISCAIFFLFFSWYVFLPTLKMVSSFMRFF